MPEQLALAVSTITPRIHATAFDRVGAYAFDRVGAYALACTLAHDHDDGTCRFGWVVARRYS